MNSKVITPIIFILIVLLSNFCLGGEKMENKKDLVVYYSLSGNTKIVAEEFARALNAEVIRIEELKPRKSKVWTMIYGCYQALRDKKTEIKPLDINLANYDRIFIGSPVWAGTITPAINSFIDKTDFRGKDIITFVTMGADNPQKSLINFDNKLIKKGAKIVDSFSISTGKKITKEDIKKSAREQVVKYGF